MKMKKYFAVAAMALLVGANAYADKTLTGRTDVKEVRIYINPGHGSWTANDRPAGTVKHGANNAYTDENNDTTNFFESNTNLQKGFGLLEKLKEYGMKFDATLNQENTNKHRIGAALDMSQNIVMSHVKAGGCPAYSDYTTHKENPDNAYYNRSLTEIAAEVDANDFDMFISIHSNAAGNNSTNYLYFAYDNDYLTAVDTNGDGNSDTYTLKDELGATIVDLSKEMSLCGWNHRILDRHTSWTSYDYTMTAAELASGKGKIGWQNLGVLNHSVPGYLVEGYFHTYEPARHRAMNWDVDRLEGVDYARGVADYFGWTKETTGDIYGVVRDEHEKFTHEFYNPRAQTNDVYMPLNNVVVTLKKGTETVATYTTDDEWNGAFIFRDVEPGTYTLEFAHESYKSLAEVCEVTVNAAQISYPVVFLEATDWVPPTNICVNYPDSLAGKDKHLSDEYNMTATEVTVLAEQLTGKTIRRQIVRDGKLYVLALDETNEPHIYVANLDDNTVTELSTTGTQTDASFTEGLKLADITFTADGVLVGGNYSRNTYSPVSGTYRVYRWENNEDGVPTGDPIEMITSQSSSMYATGRMGLTISYSGTLEEGYLIATTMHNLGGYNKHFRFEGFAVSNGASSGSSAYMNNYAETSVWNCVAFGDNHSMAPSPFYNETDNTSKYAQFVIDGDNALPTSFQTDGDQFLDNTILSAMTEGAVSVASMNGAYFKYNGKIVFVAPDVTEEGKVAGIKMFNVTNGLDKAVEIKVNGATLAEPVEYTHASAHGSLALTIEAIDRDNNVTTDAEIELFLVVDGKVYKFTTKDTDQPAKPSEYAYGLSMTAGEDKATLSFTLTGSSNQVNVVLTPVAGGEDVVYSLGALDAGEQTYELDLTELAEGDYNWSVSVANVANLSGDIVSTHNTWSAEEAQTAGGIAIDNDPESDNFGSIYVSTGNKGIYTFEPDGTAQNDEPYAASHEGTLSRATVSDGKFYIADNSTTKQGVWMWNPAQPDEFSQVTDKSASCAVAFSGEGADRVMYAISAVIAESTTGYQLYKYAIGENDTWTGGNPTWIENADVKMFNSIFDMVTCDGGFLISQYRTGSSDYAASFFYLDNNYKVYNYATSLKAYVPGSNVGSGIALSADESLFAIASFEAVDGVNEPRIVIFDVTWADGVPTFTHKCSLPTNSDNIYQMAFDYAGNLHCFGGTTGYFEHAVPSSDKNVVTPAKVAQVITGQKETSAIKVIEVENENAPVEYYNLQGVKVANPSNGIFIKKQGSRATKVVL